MHRRPGAAPAHSPSSPDTLTLEAGGAAARFLDFVDAPDFPCVGAKAALSREALRARSFGRLGDRANDAPILDALAEFARELDAAEPNSLTLNSFAAVFNGPGDTDEGRFEALLWSQLQRLHDLDVRRGQPWAEGVSRDPDDPSFSLSLGGHAYFVIGLHPGASRLARRFARPVLVFNSHRQFDRLRADGRYAKMQAATRERDLALQGSLNPNLADFGTAPETRQYSGRAVEPGWTCPFRARRT